MLSVDFNLKKSPSFISFINCQELFIDIRHLDPYKPHGHHRYHHLPACCIATKRWMILFFVFRFKGRDCDDASESQGRSNPRFFVEQVTPNDGWNPWNVKNKTLKIRGIPIPKLYTSWPLGVKNPVIIYDGFLPVFPFFFFCINGMCQDVSAVCWDMWVTS